MCTSITLPLSDGTQLFGRTLDWHEHFDERILQVPQGFSFGLDRGNGRDLPARSRYAVLGMGTEADGYPLFADGMNEHGLCMAGLRFAQSAHYLPTTATPPEGILCLAPWEMIPYVLGFCSTLDEAREALARVRVVDRPFTRSDGGVIPNSPLHWHVADGRGGGSLVVEATARGPEVHDAPVGVMANDPTFPAQMAALEAHRRAEETLPTGYDSTARFLRAASLREAYAAADPSGDSDPVTDFFALAAEVSPPVGAVPSAVGDGWQTTLYTACMDGARGLYHYTTAESPERCTVTFSDAPELTAT